MTISTMKIADLPSTPSKTNDPVIPLTGSIYEVAKIVGRAMEKQTAYSIDALKYESKINSFNPGEELAGQARALSSWLKVSEIVGYVTVGLSVATVPVAVAASAVTAVASAVSEALGALAQTTGQVINTVTNVTTTVTSGANAVTEVGSSKIEAHVTKDEAFTDTINTLASDENGRIRQAFQAQQQPAQALNSAIMNTYKIESQKTKG